MLCPGRNAAAAAQVGFNDVHVVKGNILYGAFNLPGESKPTETMCFLDECAFGRAVVCVHEP